jgi:RecB family exonuclease
MRGRVDRIDDLGGTLQVIDYKSSKNRTSKPELKKDFQMGIYKSAVEAMTGRPVGSVGHWYLRMDQEWMIELGDGELDAIKKRALDIIKRIEKGEFEATGGFQECRYCDYGDLCGQEQ